MSAYKVAFGEPENKIVNLEAERIARALDRLCQRHELACIVRAGLAFPVTDRAQYRVFLRVVAFERRRRRRSIPAIFVETAIAAGEAFQHNARIGLKPRNLGSAASEDPSQEPSRARKAKDRRGERRRPNGKDDGSHHKQLGFETGDSGQILKGHPGNIANAIKQLGVTLRQNSFSFQTEVVGLPGFGPILNDAAAARLRILIHETFGFLPSKDTYEDVLTVEAHKNLSNPIMAYLDGLKWDRRERLKTWLCYYLGAEHSPYTETIGHAFFIALVARIFKPGCKQDYMLILEGPQGAYKSLACETIAGEFFSDHLPDLREGKDVSQHLQGKWLIEIAELSALSKAEAAHMKAFLTRRVERYRQSYGRREVTQPRQCVFIGTTNDECYLRDATGGRRFWPVKIGSIDLGALADDRDQLFAEAVHLFKAGVRWWPDKEFEARYIAPEQEARMVIDPWIEPITKHLAIRDKTTVTQLARDALGIEASRLGTQDANRIRDVLKSLKWWVKRGHGGVRYYHRPTEGGVTHW